MTSEGAKGREQGSEREKCLFCSAHCPLAAASIPHELVSEAVFLPLYCGWQARWDRDSVTTFCFFSKPCRVCLFVLKKHLEFTCYSAHSWHLWEGCVWETVCVYVCVCVLRWTSSVSYKHFCRWMNCCPGGWVTCLQTLLKWKPQLGCESRCSYLRSCHFMLREPGIFLAILWHCRAERS